MLRQKIDDLEEEKKDLMVRIYLFSVTTLWLP